MLPGAAFGEFVDYIGPNVELRGYQGSVLSGLLQIEAFSASQDFALGQGFAELTRFEIAAYLPNVFHVSHAGPLPDGALLCAFYCSTVAVYGVDIASVPLPASATMVLGGLMVLGYCSRRRRTSQYSS
jgi:hypothetical protein